MILNRRVQLMPPSVKNLRANEEPRELSWRLVRGSGRAPDVVAFEESVVAFFLETALLLGVPKSVAAIYGICFASPTALTFTDVKERLDISAGSISQGLRVLREVGALKVETNLQDRRECFSPDMELRNVIARYMEERLQKQLDSGRDRLQTIADAIPANGSIPTKILRSRVKALRTWHAKSRQVLPLIKTFLKLI
jgi:DNA-binding transcriptional regulator GbsR (MarR family)